MRKLFLLIPAMLLTLAVNADPIGPNDASTTVVNALYNAVNAACADAVIELSDGIYQEGNVIARNGSTTNRMAASSLLKIRRKNTKTFIRSITTTRTTRLCGRKLRTLFCSGLTRVLKFSASTTRTQNRSRSGNG